MATKEDAGSERPRVSELVRRALEAVRDPELDEAITSLGFVASCTVSAAGDCVVRLRLPTYFCAPNFAYLMVADAHDAAAAVPGVHSVRVVLDDHFAAQAINSGVAARAGFVRSFSGEAVAELDELRADFLRKAVLAGTDRVCRKLPEIDPAMTLADAPPTADLDRLRQRRRELGLPAGDDAPLLIDVRTGRAISARDLPLHLRRARVTAVSIDANAGICRGMLAHRYPDTGNRRITGAYRGGFADRGVNTGMEPSKRSQIREASTAIDLSPAQKPAN